MISEVPAHLESTTEEVLGLPAMEPKAGNLNNEMKAALLAPMDIKAAKIVLEITPLTLPMIVEVQPTDLLVLALPTQPTIIKVVDDEGPDAMGLPAIQAMVKILTSITKLTTGKVAREATREGAAEGALEAHKVATIPAATSPGAGLPTGIFPVATMDSSSQLHGSPPRTD